MSVLLSCGDSAVDVDMMAALHGADQVGSGEVLVKNTALWGGKLLFATPTPTTLEATPEADVDVSLKAIDIQRAWTVAGLETNTGATSRAGWWMSDLVRRLLKDFSLLPQQQQQQQSLHHPSHPSQRSSQRYMSRASSLSSPAADREPRNSDSEEDEDDFDEFEHFGDASFSVASNSPRAFADRIHQGGFSAHDNDWDDDEDNMDEGDFLKKSVLKSQNSFSSEVSSTSSTTTSPISLCLSFSYFNHPVSQSSSSSDTIFFSTNGCS